MIKNTKKHRLKSRFKYWYNSLLTDNKVGLIIFLTIITILVVILLSIPIIIQSDNRTDGIWDNFATAINAWWPFSEDFGESFSDAKITIIISKTLVAVFGLLLTSALIGYISERISQRFEKLQRGKTEVIENGHIIVIGYDFNNHTLLKELLSADDNRKILLIDDKDISEVKENLKTNINIPNNTKIIYRTVDSTDIDDLKKCSVESSSAIVIQPMDDIKTIKTVMALKIILKQYPESETHIVSAINNDDYLLEFSNEKDVMLSTNSLISRILAVSSYELGLSNVLISILSFEGSELYLKDISKYAGLSFGIIAYKMYGGVPIGIYRNGKFVLIPHENMIIENNDELLYYAENKYNRVFLENTNDEYDFIKDNYVTNNEMIVNDRVLVFGYNSKFELLFNSLSHNVNILTIVNISSEEENEINTIISKRSDIDVNVNMKKINREVLYEITKSVNHIIILNRDSIEKEQSDVENMILYLKLIKLRKKYNLKWTIITELNFDNNRELIEDESNDDFVVSSNITSIMLAQMVEDYRLRPIFIELLSNNGINVCIEDAFNYILEEEKIADLRLKLLRKGTILLGYICNNDNEKEFVYNPNRNTIVKFERGDKLILMKNENK